MPFIVMLTYSTAQCTLRRQGDSKLADDWQVQWLSLTVTYNYSCNYFKEGPSGRWSQRMSKTMVCIQLSRGLIILLTSSFIILSTVQLIIQQTQLIPWPRYPSIVAILLDLVLFIGLIASLTQHLKTLIFFSWLVALTFLLIFFGNAVSSHYQSDLIGTYD